MALVLGTNCGFVTARPAGDPAESDYVVDGHCRGLKVVAPAGIVRVTEMGWWCANATDEGNYEMGIYSHNAGDDNPEALLGSDNTNAKGTDAGWKIVTGMNIALTAGVTYWLGLQVDEIAGTTRLEYAADAGQKADINWNEATMPDPFGVSDDSDAYLNGIYALYEVASGNLEGRRGSLSYDMVGFGSTPGLFK